MPRTPSARGRLAALVLCLFLGAVVPAVADPIPQHPQILEPSQAPRAARIMPRVALSYDPGMTPTDRDRDMLQKITLAKRLLDLRRPVELRRETLTLVPAGLEPSWESLRMRRLANGDRLGVTLSVPVWVPARAQKMQTYCAFARQWQPVALDLPRKSGYVWHAAKMADINNKAAYRAETIQFEVNSKFAPLAGLLLEYIFREGYYDPGKRLPLMVVRGGEDTYAVNGRGGPVTAECLSFPDHDGDSLAATVALCRFQNMAELYHGRHAPGSNHRLGLALDVNDFNYKGVVDGPPNPISGAARQYNRNGMHRLDARNLPAWYFRAAKWLGLRLPQEWTYYGYNTDWQHVDVGTK